jgi:chromate transporter
MSSPITPTDLTRRPPRSMRVRLGGFVILARMLDKGRATLAKKNGEYNYNSPTDQHLIRFLGFDPEALLKELAAGKGDGEILEWVKANAKTPRAPLEMEDWLQWVIAAACFGVTIALQAEVAILFIGAGIIGILYYGSIFRRHGQPPSTAGMALIPLGVVTAKPATVSTLGQLFTFFFKAGSLTFGSGLVIVPFLEKGLVQQTGWLNGREFLFAVAVGMLSPGPVVITATFVGYLVAGFWGSLLATVGIFLPSFLLILFVAPILIRHRENPNVQGFVKGAYGAAIGTILGACVLLSKIAIGDWLTALIAIGSLVVLFQWKVSNPLLVAVAAIIGLVAFPLLQPQWVLVK